MVCMVPPIPRPILAGAGRRCRRASVRRGPIWFAGGCPDRAVASDRFGRRRCGDSFNSDEPDRDSIYAGPQPRWAELDDIMSAYSGRAVALALVSCVVSASALALEPMTFDFSWQGVPGCS